jgi:ubiquinone/menaquinone biosynthesis C-methylase UbiE
MDAAQSHFSRLASAYNELRTTDRAPISTIRNLLDASGTIEAADFGCGPGGYSLQLAQALGDRLCLYCVDSNAEMLDQFLRRIADDTQNLRLIRARAEECPLQSNSLDCAFTFNAVHHFDAEEFFREVSRLIRTGGSLFVYTRLRSQNEGSIWGKYFPEFCERETRLFEMNELEAVVDRTPSLEIESTEYFEYSRTSTRDRLLEQALQRHYSTFCLYSKKELEAAYSRFTAQLTTGTIGKNEIHWTDRNILFVLKRQ